MGNTVTDIPNTEEVINNVILRFPDVAGDIFKQLDDKSLKNCTKVSKLWGTFLGTQRFVWIRRIRDHASLNNNE